MNLALLRWPASVCKWIFNFESLILLFRLAQYATGLDARFNPAYSEILVINFSAKAFYTIYVRNVSKLYSDLELRCISKLTFQILACTFYQPVFDKSHHVVEHRTRILLPKPSYLC